MKVLTTITVLSCVLGAASCRHLLGSTNIVMLSVSQLAVFSKAPVKGPLPTVWYVPVSLMVSNESPFRVLVSPRMLAAAISGFTFKSTNGARWSFRPLPKGAHVSFSDSHGQKGVLTLEANVAYAIDVLLLTGDPPLSETKDGKMIKGCGEVTSTVLRVEGEAEVMAFVQRAHQTNHTEGVKVRAKGNARILLDVLK